MGRWFVVILAVGLAMLILTLVFPGVVLASLTLGKLSVSWGVLIAAALLLFFGRLTAA